MKMESPERLGVFHQKDTPGSSRSVFVSMGGLPWRLVGRGLIPHWCGEEDGQAEHSGWGWAGGVVCGQRRSPELAAWGRGETGLPAPGAGPDPRWRPRARPSFPGGARGAAAEAGPRVRSLALRPSLAGAAAAAGAAGSRSQSGGPAGAELSRTRRLTPAGARGRRVFPLLGLGSVGHSEPDPPAPTRRGSPDRPPPGLA